MSRRRSVDFVAWSLYKRAWLLPAAALLVLLATSFRPETPVASTLPPTLANEQAAELLQRAQEFDERFPDRRAGTPSSFDSAQWMRDEFADIDNIKARTVPATTTSPATGRSVGLVNVEAVLPGRTRELVVIHAHRDTADANGRGGDATGQLALLALAKELSSTRDRRRSYMFVSTDGATLNGGGARALARRIARRGAVVAVIEIDRLGAGGQLRVDATPSGQYAPPLGLVEAARDAVGTEGGERDGDGVLTQAVRLAAPITLREHGQLVSEGLPAVTVTAGDDQLRESGDANAETAAVASGLRAVQRLAGTLDHVDQIQSAGKTFIATDRRVYRGWALKIFIASLLVPVWVAAVDLLVRHRRGWNLLAAVGTCARAMLAGMTSVVALWLLGALRLLPSTGDRPPNPGALDDVHWIGLGLWATITVGAWLLARGPDWRRSRTQRLAVGGADTPELVLGLIALVVISVLTLAINPYTVLFAVPALHTWLWLASRRVFGRGAVWMVWCGGAVAPLLAVAALGARGDAGLGSAWFALQLVQTRTVPPLLALLIGAGTGTAVLVLLAALGKVGAPALPRLRAGFAQLTNSAVPAQQRVPAPVRGMFSALRTRAQGLRVPTRSSRARTRTREDEMHRQPRERATTGTGAARDAATRDRELRVRAAQRANQRRVKSR